MDKRPIGVFDSGIGGLSLLRELDSLMPYEDYIYVGDTAYMPYGTRTEQEIVNRSEQIIRFLEGKQCKMIVIACNTISGLLPEITRREKHDTPVVGIINYGCVAAALYVTYNFSIGVLATRRTVNSGVYREVIDNFDPSVSLFAQECTDLIPHIEAGHIGSPEVRVLAEKYLRPMLKEDIDTLILGCTHLPFIKNIIQDIIGPSVILIDPARRTAVLCLKTLRDNGLLKINHKEPGKKKFFVTGKPADFKSSAQLVLGWKFPRVERIKL